MLHVRFLYNANVLLKCKFGISVCPRIKTPVSKKEADSLVVHEAGAAQNEVKSAFAL